MKRRFWQKSTIVGCIAALTLSLGGGVAQAQYTAVWHDYNGYDWTKCALGATSCSGVWTNVHTHFATNVIHSHLLCGQPTNESYWNGCWQNMNVPAGAAVDVICWHEDLLQGSSAIFDKVSARVPNVNPNLNFGYEPDSNVILSYSDRSTYVPYCDGKWPN